MLESITCNMETKMISAILELSVIAGFIVAYQMQGIFFATKILMIASLAQILIEKLILRNNISPWRWTAFALVMLMGALTLFLHNEAFIKWKVTVFYSVCILITLIAPIITKKSVLKSMLENKLNLPNNVWSNLNYILIGYFLLLASLNTFLLTQFSTKTWLYGKTIGSIAITLLFILFTVPYIIKNIKPAGEAPCASASNAEESTGLFTNDRQADSTTQTRAHMV